MQRPGRYSLTTKDTSWGMIDTSLHNVNVTLDDDYSPKLETTRAISPFRARKNHLAANYAVSGEQRVALKQKRNSWGSIDILDLLDVDDFADDEEGEGPTVVSELADAEQGRRNAMGEKQVQDMLISAADQKKKIVTGSSSRPRRTFSGKMVAPLKHPGQANQRPSLMRQPQHLARQQVQP